MELKRQIKYLYLKLIRLRGGPHELSLGMAFGVFAGVMPIIPFQTTLAITLAVFFKSNKITAAAGTWVSNPLNWYFLYYYSYKLGSSVLGLPEKNALFTSIMEGFRSGEELNVIIGRILGAGGSFVAAFVVGGLALGIVFAPLAYFISLQLFKSIKAWRESRQGSSRFRLPGP